MKGCRWLQKEAVCGDWVHVGTSVWSCLSGSQARIDEVDSTPVLDALETSFTAAPRVGMDTINNPNGDAVR